jgi:UDP-2-acetamido-3-amino-2,3-dideoxy-glucuronate N-acetyltransferase
VQIHPLADVKSMSIGEGTQIWQFSVVLDGVVIGDNCNIGSHVFIENGVTIGNNVTIKNGAMLFTGLIVQDNVFIGPNVTFTNTKFPKSRRSKIKTVIDYPTTVIKRGASIGGGAVILPGLTIGDNSMIGAGSVVTKSVERSRTVLGSPAKVVD